MSLIKTLVALIAIIILCGVGYLIFEAMTSEQVIASYEECVAAGYTIEDVFPATCTTPDGQTFTEEIEESDITSYEECVAAGYPILESYPEQCRTPGGQTFTNNIGNQLEQSENIKIDSPKPNARISSPLIISGQARGTWYFEATFPLVIRDANGRELARSFAEAEGDWMTEDFVPFTANVEFSESTTATGTIILEKANPSGLPQHAGSLNIPINFSDIRQVEDDSRAQDGCIITGCSNTVCSDQEVVTTCEYQESYACYQTAICARDNSGQCIWQETTTLKQCLDQYNL